MQESKQIGFIVDNLSSSQLSYDLVTSINNHDKKYDEDFVVFFENSSPVVKEPHFALMGIHELWNFYGVGIATSSSSCFSLIKSNAPIKKFFYVWDLEWFRAKNAYSYIIDAFTNENVNLIARSKDHAKAIKNFCNREICGIFDFNEGLETLKGIIE